MKLTKTLTRIGLAAVLVSTLNLQLSTAHAQGTAFTYQGVLNDGGAPATGLYDLEFRAFDAVTGGAQQGSTVTANDVPVTNGLFTTTLDFGAAVFTGPARWLNIAVRPGASVGAYTDMLPRQPILASPYAVFAGGSAAAGVTGTLPDARLSANVALRAGGNAFTGNQSVMSGNVGIGTTIPGGRLDIAGTGASDDGKLVVQTAGQFGPQLRLRNTAGGGEEWVLVSNGTINQGGAGQFGLVQVSSGLSRFVITPAGIVGIGTTTPTVAKLVVSGTGGSHAIPAYYAIDSVSGGAFYPAVGGVSDVSISASHGIEAAFVRCLSDARIKTVTGVSDPARDLDLLRRIEVTDYVYRDQISRGSRPQKKVIAQQVEEVFPQAVSQSTGVVPDIFQKAAQKAGWVQLATDLKVGDRVKLMSEKEEGIHEVLEVRKDAFRTAFKPATEKVFVFGREVKDFRSVDYEAISMLNVSATQELARKVKAQETKLTAQEEELTGLRAELSKLRSERTSLAQTVNDMEARFVRLEQAMNNTTLPAVKDVSASADVK